MYHFRSDNCSGVHDSFLKDFHTIQEEKAASYGGDDYTKELEVTLSTLFNKKLSCHFSLTGSFANQASINALLPKGGRVFCSPCAHIKTCEHDVRNFLNPNLLFSVLQDHNGKIQADDLENELKKFPQENTLVSITQTTEKGTYYTHKELQDICNIATQYNAKIHLDGARLTHAVVGLHTTYADLLKDLPIDIMTFGTTKSGTLAGELIIVFDQDYAKTIHHTLFKCGHQPSKMRFFNLNMNSFLQNGLGEKLVKNSQIMAQTLLKEIQDFPQLEIIYPVETNHIFITIPEIATEHLKNSGWEFCYYDYEGNKDVIRILTSFQTTHEEIELLVKALKTALNKSI
ncbi:hypothetical protein COB57_02810 [Candidatus Peregrinibacteria bacterium]|nr:MAG: hypothetical protein COB57_02810 [Candidatus Peregrinibacteria bacterium]